MSLMYLVNKPKVLKRLFQWLIFFLEFNFSIIYKLKKIMAPQIFYHAPILEIYIYPILMINMSNANIYFFRSRLITFYL